MSSGSWLCCMPCYWLRTNSSLHKASLTVVTLLVTSLLVASPVLFLISSVPANEQPYKDCSVVEEEDCFLDRLSDASLPVCETTECKAMARKIQYSLSWNHDPCRDFYQFSCGGWANSNKKRRKAYELESDLSFSTIQTTVHLQIQQLLSINASIGRFKKLGLFYASCLISFEKPVETSRMYMILDRLGGYLPPGSLGPSDLTSLFASIIKANGCPLFDIYLDNDVNNTTRPSIVIDLPRYVMVRSFLTDPRPYEYFDIERHHWSTNMNFHRKMLRNKRDARTQNVHYDYIKGKHLERKNNILEMIVDGMLPKGMNRKEKILDKNRILLFTRASYEIIPGRKEFREQLFDPALNEPYSIEKLQESFPFVSWVNLLKEIFPDSVYKNFNIYVMSHQYMVSVSELISRYEKRVTHNALLAMFARDSLYMIANHTAAINEKHEFCTDITERLFSNAVSALYLSQYTQQYLDNLHQRAVDMFVELKKAFFLRVEKALWLDTETKVKVMDRLATMSAKFVAWPQLRNDTFVDDLLESINVTDNFFDNVVLRHQTVRHIQMSINMNHVNYSWPFPYIVNAFYETDFNSIVVPLVFLTQPHFSKGVPPYIWYGTIGNVLAHEMLHAFDYSVSSQSPSPLWKGSAALEPLTEKLSCLVKSYQTTSNKGFKFMGLEMKVEFDGNATNEENAADVSGARIAWGAWRAVAGPGGGETLAPLQLAPAKLFYISMAQLYCANLSPEDYIVAVENDFHMTAPERINGLIRNSAQFGDVFKCSVGSPMNPANKCTIW